MIPRLIRDEIGVVPVPTVHATPTTGMNDRPDACSGLSEAQRRRRNRQVSSSRYFSVCPSLTHSFLFFFIVKHNEELCGSENFLTPISSLYGMP